MAPTPKSAPSPALAPGSATTPAPKIAPASGEALAPALLSECPRHVSLETFIIRLCILQLPCPSVVLCGLTAPQGGTIAGQEPYRGANGGGVRAPVHDRQHVPFCAHLAMAQSATAVHEHGPTAWCKRLALIYAEFLCRCAQPCKGPYGVFIQRDHALSGIDSHCACARTELPPDRHTTAAVAGACLLGCTCVQRHSMMRHALFWHAPYFVSTEGILKWLHGFKRIVRAYIILYSADNETMPVCRTSTLQARTQSQPRQMLRRRKGTLP